MPAVRVPRSPGPAAGAGRPAAVAEAPSHPLTDLARRYAWAEALFTGLRAEGGFRIDARRRAGATEQVRISSLAGEPCRIRTRLPLPVRCLSGHRVTTDQQGISTVELPRGATALLVGSAGAAGGEERPVVITRPASGPWGLAKPQALTPAPSTSPTP